MKFGISVKVKKPGFYNGVIGIIIRYDESDNTYFVLLPYNCVSSFYENELVKVKPKAGAK